MIGIVIVAHGGLAREYLSAVEHVVGKQDGVRAISIEDDHDRQAKQIEICAAADAVDTGDGVVVVTDMFGGSPSNLSLRACVATDRRIIYGANLPLLIKLAKSRDLERTRSRRDRTRGRDASTSTASTWADGISGRALGTTERQLQIVNEKGLHARASAKFVEVVETH